MLSRDDLLSLFESWQLHLRAERKSPQTLKAYSDGVRLFLAWCDATGTAVALDRRTVAAWVAHLLDSGAEASTARSRQLALRRFSAWLAEEGETDRDDLIGLKPPKLDSKVVESLTGDQVTALIKACGGKEFRDRRDEAIVRLMVETGLRSEELLSMALPDTNLGSGLATVRRGRAARAARGVRCRSGRVPARRSTGTSGYGARIGWPEPRCCGSATGARSSATTRCATPCSTGRSWPASTGSTRTCSGTPPPPGGSTRAAARAG